MTTLVGNMDKFASIGDSLEQEVVRVVSYHYRAKC